MPCGICFTANCEAALLVDASNAFNSINRKAALHNIAILCLSLSTVLHNTYSAMFRLFVTGEGGLHLPRAPPREILSLWRCMHWQ